ncbi:MAG: aminotransferase class I/II-fold pyridoxal phosphate-dependent enzyme [Thermosynechococcaceae cyanobacterium]
MNVNPNPTQPTPFLDALQTAANASAALFCTPGHKQGHSAPPEIAQLLGHSVFHADLPDLPGFNLFEPDGFVATAQALAAETFGADRTWFLVNGSTVGIAAAILATCGPGDKLILPRNTHQSAISGLILSGAMPIFIPPDTDPHTGLAYCIAPDAVALALNQHPDAKAVLMVSPTYQGVCGNVMAIAELAHRHPIPLIVDEAHGAHFAFHPQLPTPALAAGADLVVQSTHKTLSALTQAAMLHLRGTHIDAVRVTQALQLLQSSSPSNLLLASLDAARQQMATEGESLLTQTLALAHQARSHLQTLPGLSVLEPSPDRSAGFCDLDPTRLTVDLSDLTLDGYGADELLSQSFGVVAELPLLRHLTFILSIGNTPADIARLLNALEALAADYASLQTKPTPLVSLSLPPVLDIPALSPRDAFFAPQALVPLEQAVGCISAATLCPYPPGIPLILPGEIITSDAIAQLRAIQAAGGFISGNPDAEMTQILVVRPCL